MSKDTQNRMWGGCFTGCTAASLCQLNTSVEVDQRLYREDITASKVYAQALLKAGIISHEDCTSIVNGLDMVRQEWDSGKLVILDTDEDVHSVVERRLRELVGDAAGKLHTGRSRNDQVATDMRLWLINNIPQVENLLRKLIKSIVVRAEREIDILMPGYTHLQRAQPVRWSHFILSHAWSFHSDASLLLSTRARAGTLPLGSGALAGNPFDIDRKEIAQRLGFSEISMNSMNAVGNRDFVAEFLFWCALCASHLSRLSQDLIIFSTAEFGFVRISDSYSTGSSLLPQKRNADGLELARAAAPAMLGNTVTMLATLHALPSTYNKDLQGDKKMLFDSFDTICQVLEVVYGTIETLTINEANCRGALGSELLAARLAHWLVRRGQPFRSAHHVVGRAVAKARQLEMSLDSLPEQERIAISEHLSGDLSSVWELEEAVEENQVTGGTARGSVMEQIQVLQKWLAQL